MAYDVPVDWYMFSTCCKKTAEFNVSRLPALRSAIETGASPYPLAVEDEMRAIIRRAGELGIHVDDEFKDYLPSKEEYIAEWVPER